MEMDIDNLRLLSPSPLIKHYTNQTQGLFDNLNKLGDSIKDKVSYWKKTRIACNLRILLSFFKQDDIQPALSLALEELWRLLNKTGTLSEILREKESINVIEIDDAILSVFIDIATELNGLEEGKLNECIGTMLDQIESCDKLKLTDSYHKIALIQACAFLAKDDNKVDFKDLSEQINEYQKLKNNFQDLDGEWKITTVASFIQMPHSNRAGNLNCLRQSNTMQI
jgi:hypothetical protein